MKYIIILALIGVAAAQFGAGLGVRPGLYGSSVNAQTQFGGRGGYPPQYGGQFRGNGQYGGQQYGGQQYGGQYGGQQYGGGQYGGRGGQYGANAGLGVHGNGGGFVGRTLGGVLG
ncbi:unnamed protein product [Auanema sp. JU1783]|nr:unnamed protein product [Auanema sp. JU1783]